MSETDKSKQREWTTSAVSSSSSGIAGSRVSSSSTSANVYGTTRGSSSSAFASSSVSSSTTSSSTSRHRHTAPLLPPAPPVLKYLPPPTPAPAPAPVGWQRAHYPTPLAIRKAFLNFMKDPECLNKAADYLYESLLEDAVMGIYLEVHHSYKSGSMEAIEGRSEDDTAFKIVDTPNYDVFGMSKARKPMDCNCPNCDRLVAAIRFAPHLEKCMGMGRKTSRTASRRLANAKEGNTSYFSANVSDDEDDADWSSEKRRKKMQTSRTNGSKKNGKSS